jgi:uncharacterized protein YdiU (UPF0061 family)
MLELSESYTRLPAHFYTRIAPAAVADPRLIRFNAALAEELGLDLRGLGEADLAAVFSGRTLATGSAPIAMAYAGHQFGHFVPQLGDGRAILLGEVIDRRGRRRDIQLKGSGRTPYSRNGDGRAALGPVLREYVVSEAMHALGIPATRALAAVTSGEVVYRESGPLPGAVLTRVAASHVRVGTFQYFAARGDTDAVRQLADFVIERHFPALASADDPYLELLRAVVGAQADLVARWMLVGFIHGVMNTDNMTVSGETIDFGPCAFMDAYDPAAVFSSIDHRGRYAFANQPAAAQWNLARFAETLLSCIDGGGDRALDLAGAAVLDFSSRFDALWLGGMRRKLGLFIEEEGDAALVQSLLDAMQRNSVDFTLLFRRLCAAVEGPAGDPAAAAGFAEPADYHAWALDWRARLGREPQTPGERAAFMRLVNPTVIPRNHRVEAMIAAAVRDGDFAPFDALSRALARPFEDTEESRAFTAAPKPEERVLQTFCGT